MTIAQLKQAIAELPDDMDVFIEEPEIGFHYSMVNKVEVREISFYESEDGTGVTAKDNVLVLTDGF